MPSKLPKNHLGTFPFPAHPEVEDDRRARPAVLPKVSLVIFASCPLGLNAHRRFIGLGRVSGQQLLGRPADGPEQFTNPHHPTRYGPFLLVPVFRDANFGNVLTLNFRAVL